MTYDQNTPDPLAGGDSTPAVSWADLPVGTVKRLAVTEGPKLVQTRNFDDGEPAFWPAGSDGVRNPKMGVVVAVTENGEDKGLWANKPSALFTALREAQVAAGARITTGGTLTVTLVEKKVNPEKPRNKPANIFTVKYEAPDAFAEDVPQHSVNNAVAAIAVEALTKPAAPTPPPAQQDGGAALIALKAKLTSLRAAGLEAGQIAAVPGVVGLDGQPMTAATVASLLVA